MLYSSWGSDHDVRWLETLENLDLVFNRLPSIYNLSSDFWKEPSKSIELVLDLICELSSMTKDQS